MLAQPKPIAWDKEAPRLIRSARAAYQQAVQRTGGEAGRELEVGRLRIRLAFAGQALLPAILPAFEHLLTEARPSPRFTISLWDSASTGVDLPLTYLFEEIGDAYRQASQSEVEVTPILRFLDDRCGIFYWPETRILNLIDLTQNQALFWIQDSAAVPFYESGAPLRALLHTLLRGQGLHLVHAAAVGASDGGVLLVGKGGKGKSSTALSCLHAGMGYLSDDYTVVALAPQPIAYSLYNAAKIPENQPQIAASFSSADQPAAVHDGKRLLFLGRHHPERILKAFPIQALLLPQITGSSEARLTPVSPAKILAALAPSSILQLPGAGKEDFHFLSKLVRRLPCYILHLSTDLSANPACIAELLSSQETG